jgi:D-methionine transport system substrate-binding protein
MTRKLLALLALAILAVGVAACGDDEAASSADADPSAPLRVGATPVPHGEILDFIAADLAPKEGLELEIREFSDYVQPNTALGEGELDANYFQTVPYLEDQAKARGLDLVSVKGVHIEPLGIYSRKVQSLDAVPEGATVAIPNDATNAGRALLLLQANGLLELREGADQSADVRDVEDNPKKLELVEVEAAQTPRSLDDAELAVVNGNYALEAGLKPADDALALETPENNPNVNVLASLAEERDDPRVRKLAKLLASPQVARFIERKYEGAVLPAS